MHFHDAITIKFFYYLHRFTSIYDDLTKANQHLFRSADSIEICSGRFSELSCINIEELLFSPLRILDNPRERL